MVALKNHPKVGNSSKAKQIVQVIEKKRKTEARNEEFFCELEDTSTRLACSSALLVPFGYPSILNLAVKNILVCQKRTIPYSLKFIPQ